MDELFGVTELNRKTDDPEQASVERENTVSDAGDHKQPNETRVEKV